MKSVKSDRANHNENNRSVPSDLANEHRKMKSVTSDRANHNENNKSVPSDLSNNNRN